MKSRWILIGIACLALSALGRQPEAWVPGQALVRFASPLTLEQAQLELDRAQFQVSRPLVRRLNIFLVKFDARLPVPEAVQMLSTHPRLLWAQPDHILKERRVPDDPLYSTQWNLSQGTDADVDAPEAWEYSVGGTDPGGNEIVVAVVDGGCQLDHPDLVANLWINDAEDGGTPGVDDDGNGYVDDVNGWNAVGNNGSVPDDDHGTHVSGIVGATGDNGSMVCGVNWNVKIMEISTDAQTSHVSIAYGYVLDQKTMWWDSGGTHGANVVSTNSSFGIDFADCESEDYPIWNDLYNSMGEVGILSAGATANMNIDIDLEGDVPTGCASPYLIAVTNTNSSDVKNSGAAYGTISVDLGAPGTRVPSTYWGSTTAELTGTSMATPHVAGAVALMHAAASVGFFNYYMLYPDSAALAIKQMILDDTDPLPSLNGITVSGGRLNLHSAVTSISQFTGPSPDTPYLQVTRSEIVDYPTGDNDAIFDPGETVELILTVLNLGDTATSVNATLTSNDTLIEVTDSLAGFGTILPIDSSRNDGDPFVLHADSEAPLEHVASLSVTFTADGGYEVTRNVTIEIGQKQVYWLEDVESGENGWTHANVLGGFGDQWHVSSEQSYSASHAWKCGDTGSGDYANLLDAGLVSPAVELAPQSELVFAMWIESELSGSYPDSAFDGGLVELSLGGGPFVQITPIDSYNATFRTVSGGGNPFTGPLPGVKCFAGLPSWQEVAFDLADYAGESARFRFRFCTDGGVTQEGWYVDDIRLRGAQVTPPDPVSDLVIYADGNDVVLVWSPPPTGATLYYVYRSEDWATPPGDAILLGTTPDTYYVDVGAAALIDRADYAVRAAFE